MMHLFIMIEWLLIPNYRRRFQQLFWKYRENVNIQNTWQQSFTQILDIAKTAYPVTWNCLSTLGDNRPVSHMREPVAACLESAGKLWQLCLLLNMFWT